MRIVTLHKIDTVYYEAAGEIRSVERITREVRTQDIPRHVDMELFHRTIAHAARDFIPLEEKA